MEGEKETEEKFTVFHNYMFFFLQNHHSVSMQATVHKM